MRLCSCASALMLALCRCTALQQRWAPLHAVRCLDGCCTAALFRQGLHNRLFLLMDELLLAMQGSMLLMCIGFMKGGTLKAALTDVEARQHLRWHARCAARAAPSPWCCKTVLQSKICVCNNHGLLQGSPSGPRHGRGGGPLAPPPGGAQRPEEQVSG